MLRFLIPTILLGASTLLCLTSCEEFDANVTECLPEIPPLIDPNATMVALQMHQWLWIENLTVPDWAPRTESGGLYYEFLRPGFIMSQTLDSLALGQKVNLSYVTNGDTLCAATLTQYRNRSAGAAATVSYACNKVCHDNFTSLGTRLNVPLLVYDIWVISRRVSEYLAFDAVDPDSRAVYNCTGWFDGVPMGQMSNHLGKRGTCRSGDVCLFNYNTKTDIASAGCRADFRLSWCVSDMDLCSYNINDECPVCCRGSYCNRDVAQKAYQRWQARMASTTQDPGTTTKGADFIGTPGQMLGAGVLGVVLLLQCLR